MLVRIAGLFARRGYNIDTLAVAPDDREGHSRITITIDGANHSIDQVTKQLHKLINVLKIRDLEPDNTVARELALFKVAVDNGPARAEVLQICNIFRGKVVDVTKRSLIIEVTGSPEKINNLDEMLQPFGIVEMMRTGEMRSRLVAAATRPERIFRRSSPAAFGVWPEGLSPLRRRSNLIRNLSLRNLTDARLELRHLCSGSGRDGLSPLTTAAYLRRDRLVRNLSHLSMQTHAAAGGR